MSRKAVGLGGLCAFVVGLALVDTNEAQGFLFFKKGCGCGAPAACCAPAPAASCCEPAPAPSCCDPAPTCCKAPKVKKVKCKKVKKSCCEPAPKCCEPAPACCAPAPSCCAPAPTCAGSSSGAADEPMTETAPTPPAEEPAPAPEK